MDELTQRVIAIVAQAHQIPEESVTPESEFADLGIDSLTGLSIISELESEFGVEVPNEEALTITGVGQVIDSLRRHLGKDA